LLRAARRSAASRTRNFRTSCASSPEQRKAELDRQTQTRKTLNEKLAALVQKRDAFVAGQAAAAPAKTSSFDRAVEDTLKAQTKR
jgi:hypothetical protein